MRVAPVSIVFGSCVVALLAAPLQLAAQIGIIDNYNEGSFVFTNSGADVFDGPDPSVFPGLRAYILDKQDETSGGSLTIAEGVLTWNQTTTAEAVRLWYTAGSSTPIDLSGYSAFRITLLSAPENPGQLGVGYTYWWKTNQHIASYAYVSMPSSGTIDIPFELFELPEEYGPVDFTQGVGVHLEMLGWLLDEGTYVFDDFQLVIPEPTTFTLLGLGSLALVMGRRRR